MSRSNSKRSPRVEAKTTLPAEFLKEPNNDRPSSAQSTNSVGSSTSIFYHFVRKLKQNYKAEQYQRVLRFGVRRWRSMILLDEAHNLSHAEIHEQLFKSKFKKVWNKTKSLEMTRSLSSSESFLHYYKCPACDRSKNFRKRSHSSSTTDSSHSESSSQSSASSHHIKKKKCL